MRQREDDMNNRTKSILTFLLCAAIISSFGCASTTPKAESPQATRPVYEIAQDGTINVRYVNQDVPQTPKMRPGWQCKVARILHASIVIYANPNLAAVYVAAAMK